VADDVRRLITGGTYAAGDRLPSEVRLAEFANPRASNAELWFTGQQLHASLVDTLRVALSLRLRRLPSDLAVDPPGRLEGSVPAGLSECLCTTPVLVQRWTHSALCVGQARGELRRTLEAWHLAELSERAELVLSELLTNAVRHANVPTTGRSRPGSNAPT
jgi:hypothetical protein